ncbi:amino acid ABC transporter substrate-binding protein [Candidatus Dependentiae bacterium]|nr:amino acid ABC transporter substrate-binding protein [Candidatus Dependentiae bacterium]
MKTKIQFSFLLFIALILVFLYIKHRPHSSLDTGHQTIILGISADNPPFTFFKDDRFQGFEVDVAQEIASRLGYSLEIKDLDFSGLIPAVKNNVIDFSISSFNITPERKRNIDFSIPYYESMPTVIGNDSYKTEVDLQGITVGVQLGSVWETFAKQLAQTNPTLTVSGFHRINQMVQELSQETINAILIDAEVAKKIAKNNPKWTLSTLKSASENNQYGIIFKPNSPLVESFNNTLQEMKTDGMLNKLTEKWFTVSEQ